MIKFQGFYSQYEDVKTSQANQKALERIGADMVHLYNKGTGVRVGLVDSGISNHAAFRDRIKGGWDFVRNQAPDGTDGFGHGTFQAGIIAAGGRPFIASRPGGPLDLGIKGVAPEAHLYDLRVSDDGGLVTWDRAAAAVDWAIENRVEILYLGFGSTNYNQALSEALDRAYRAGIIVVAPVGSTHASYTNTGSDWPSIIPSALFPARHPKVIGVGEVDLRDRPDHWEYIWIPDRFPWQGPALVRFYHARDGSTELVAPGGGMITYNSELDVGVGSTVGTNSMGLGLGTSISAAYAAGVAALIIAGGIASDAEGVRQRLVNTATALTSKGFSDETNEKIYGHGLVNALLAVPPASITSDNVERQRRELGIGTNGRGDKAMVTTLANIPPRVTVPADPIPYLSRYPSPRNGETNVPVNNPVRFTVKSDTVGIDISTVRVKIKGEVYKYGGPGFSFTGNRRSYDIEVRPVSSGWNYEETVDVEIEAWDLAGRPGLVYERILR
ncbi:MAG: S8 family serine peptidase [Planctomycetota bacterium]